MNKYLLAACTFCLLSVAVKAQSSSTKKFHTIQGKVAFLNPVASMKYAGYDINKVYLGQREGGNYQLIDSVKVNADGSWQLKIPVTKPKLYEIDIIKWDRTTIWSDGDLSISSRGYDTAKMKIKNPPYVFIEGSSDNQCINLINHVIYRDYQQMIAISQEMYQAGLIADTSWRTYLKKQNAYQQLSKDFTERIKTIIRAYQDRPVAIYGLKILDWEKEQDFILPILSKLEKKYPWSSEIVNHQKNILARIAQVKLLNPGNPIPTVLYKNPQGLSISTKDFKGKYLLIDFWASWCGPCRAAVPAMKELHSKYKEKGLALLSISIDKTEKEWRKALEEEQMPWEQLISPDMNKTMESFVFSGIPTLFLVDTQGRILERYTGFVPGIKDRLKEIFGF